MAEEGSSSSRSSPLPQDITTVMGEGDTHKLIVIPNGSDMISGYYTTEPLVSTDSHCSKSFKSKLMGSSKTLSTCSISRLNKLRNMLKSTMYVISILALILCGIFFIEVYFNCRSIQFIKTKSTEETISYFGGYVHKNDRIQYYQKRQQIPGMACWSNN